MNTFWSNSFSNRLHLILALSGMLFGAGLLAYALFGVGAVYLLIGLSILGLFVSGRVPTETILKVQGGRPLQYREVPQLHERVQILAQRAGLPVVPQLFLLPSGRLNAFAAGSQDAPIIGLTSGLLYRLSAREINGVLAHEIAHLMHDDLRLKAFTQVLSRVSHIMATIGKWILFFSIPAVLAGVMPFPVSILLLLIVVPFMVQVLDLAISRNREWEADATAARLTGDPIGLAAALQKLYRMRLFAGFPFGRARQEMHALPEWLQTHPNIRKRISSLVEMAKTRT